jgi:ribosomal protein S18 acetylase RimI-like enzyme
MPQLSSKSCSRNQVITATPPNQPHRGDVAKLLVHRSARHQGIANRLMRAEKLYERLGWNKVGVIPNYALYPDGRWCDTTVFYKQL